MRARPAKRKGPTRGRRRWSPPTSAPAMRRVAPAILQPAEPFLDLSGEDIRKRMYLTTDAGRPRAVPAARPHHPGVARLSRLARRRPGRRASAISARCSATAATRRRNSCRPASNRSAAPTRPRPTPRCWRSGWRRPRITASPRPTSASATSALFAALIAALDLRAGLEAAADQGFQPQGQSSRTTSTA